MEAGGGELALGALGAGEGGHWAWVAVQSGTGLGPSASAQPPLVRDRLREARVVFFFAGGKGIRPPPLRGRTPEYGWTTQTSIPLPPSPPPPVGVGWGAAGWLEVCGSVGWPGASSMPKPWGSLGRAVPFSSLPPHKGRRL